MDCPGCRYSNLSDDTKLCNMCRHEKSMESKRPTPLYTCPGCKNGSYNNFNMLCVACSKKISRR